MVKNLNVDKFLNGDPIPHIESYKEWMKAGNEGNPAWCYNDNKAKNGNVYDKLYNWFAINDSRGLAPEDWHVPSKAEFEILLQNYGGTGTSSYSALIKNGKRGFNALFGGSCKDAGSFTILGNNGNFWSSSEYSSSNAWAMYIYNSLKKAGMVFNYKSLGFSVRCLKDN